MATRSARPSVSASIRIAVFTSGSLSGGAIEPETSSRKTRLRGGVRSGGRAARACRPMSARRWRGFHGHVATSVVTENGALVVGSGYVEAEVVDQLLDADGVGRRQRALVEEAADVRVRGGVDVDRKGGERIVGDAAKLVLVESCRRLRCWNGGGTEVCHRAIGATRS